MRAVIIGHIVAAYLEDTDDAEFAACLAEHLPHLSDAYLGNPLALSRHLMAQGFGEPLPASGFGRDAETIMRAIVKGPCRHFAEFSKRQLAFDLRRDFERPDAPTMATPAQQQQARAGAAPVTRDAFWSHYQAEAEALYASGKLPPPLRATWGEDRTPSALASQLTADMRERIEANPSAVDVNGPAMKATLRAHGVRGKSRRDVLAFIGGLV